MIGIILSFGHSILAMSGEETLAQVYREVESPKLKNFKRAAFVVFLYSMLLTSLISFFAVMIIPDNVRMSQYAGNLIGGLAMNVVGPQWARLALNVLVVLVGSLILSGAVNTAIVGSNGVLNRVSEDGVLPDWFLKPHPRYGTTSRLINLVVLLQIVTIILSGGNVLTLGEAYAFGVVWSFVFMSMSMLVLRFKRPGHREYEVPFNIKVGRYDIPLGMTADLPGPGDLRDRQPADQGGGHDHGHPLHGRLLRGLLGQRAGPPTSGRHGPPRAPRAVQPERGRPAQRGLAEPDPALPQAGGDPLAAQPGHAREVPRRDRPRDDGRRRHDRLGRTQGQCRLPADASPITTGSS